MLTETILITGATRGLGLATAKALAAQGHKVIVTGRDKAKLEKIQQTVGDELMLHIQLMDVDNTESVHAAKTAIEHQFGHIDCLINNAGILDSGYSFQTLPMDVVASVMNTNAFGPIRIMQLFRPLLVKSQNPRIVNISSGMASLTDMGPGNTAYRMSKAALNVITLQAHHDFEQDNIRVLALCPGWVKTDMGGSGAAREVEEGIAGILWAVSTPASGPSGKFFRDGKEISW